MELIDRYLQAVRFWLPRRQQDDIVAELAEDLRAQAEEREAELGRKLTESDVETLLRQRGSPILVANGYLPQHSLIGPVLFPVYVFVLKIVSLCVVGSLGVMWLIALLTHAFSAVSGHPAASIPGATLGSLWTSWFASAGAVTLVFAILERAVIERAHGDARLIDQWNPRSLPPLRHRHAIPRSSSAIEIAVSLCVLVWWSFDMASPFTLRFGDLRVVFSPQWIWFFWAILALTLGSAALALANLLRPWWTVARTACRIALDLAGSVFFCWLLRANIVTAIDWPGAAPQRTTAVVLGINLWLGRSFPYAIALAIVIVAANLYRMFRLWNMPQPHRRHPAPAQQQ